MAELFRLLDSATERFSSDNDHFIMIVKSGVDPEKISYENFTLGLPFYNKTDSDAKYATNSNLSLKADKTYVDTQLLLKPNFADIYTRIESDSFYARKEELDDKADISYVNENLDDKANISDVYTKQQADDKFLEDIELTDNSIIKYRYTDQGLIEESGLLATEKTTNVISIEVLPGKNISIEGLSPSIKADTSFNLSLSGNNIFSVDSSNVNLYAHNGNQLVTSYNNTVEVHGRNGITMIKSDDSLLTLTNPITTQEILHAESNFTDYKNNGNTIVHAEDNKTVICHNGKEQIEISDTYIEFRDNESQLLIPNKSVFFEQLPAYSSEGGMQGILVLANGNKVCLATKEDIQTWLNS